MDNRMRELERRAPYDEQAAEALRQARERLGLGEPEDTRSAYVRAYEAEMAGVEAVSVGGCPGCDECGLDEDAEDWHIDSSFSWSGCEACGSSYGGDMTPAHGLVDGQLIHFMVCHDCVQFIAYGEEPEEWYRSPEDRREAEEAREEAELAALTAPGGPYYEGDED